MHTQTPPDNNDAQDNSSGNSSSRSHSASPTYPIMPGPVDYQSSSRCSSNGVDNTGNDQENGSPEPSVVSKFSSSPRPINSYLFAREPPDGAEKVQLHVEDIDRFVNCSSLLHPLFRVVNGPWDVFVCVSCETQISESTVGFEIEHLKCCMILWCWVLLHFPNNMLKPVSHHPWKCQQNHSTPLLFQKPSGFWTKFYLRLWGEWLNLHFKTDRRIYLYLVACMLFINIFWVYGPGSPLPCIPT